MTEIHPKVKVESDNTFAQHETAIKQQIAQIAKDAELLKSQQHPQLKDLLEILDVARLKHYANIDVRYQLSIEHAQQALEFTKNQIELDYAQGREDIKEKLFSDLRKKKKDTKDVIDRMQSKCGVSSNEMNLFNDLKIPNKKKERKSFRGSYNFKLPEAEAKQDLQIIRALAEELDQGKK
ncbi:hypothetical protein SS50377_20264 [Spironucleus salmonicida]|uniref:Uncharacterized protein n=1 Tax=Spironucleus salmonicida TaxID=348837 RepID=V6LM76_9EUKA|nr:hypothetical protein SS50377_20264 [Spironucleus salmonicida]|eukprot:EST45318.1 hypothetical protein SS50377_14895 [Spironucleus salmonicida]